MKVSNIKKKNPNYFRKLSKTFEKILISESIDKINSTSADKIFNVIMVLENNEDFNIPKDLIMDMANVIENFVDSCSNESFQNILSPFKNHQKIALREMIQSYQNIC